MKSLSQNFLKKQFSSYLGLLLVLLGLTVFFGLVTENFFSAITFRTIANQIPDAIFIAVGMTYVLIIAGIDLSVGSVLGLSAAVLGACMVQFELSLLPAIMVCVSVGAICGCLNGMITIRWTLPSFIVTLGMLEAARGGTYLVSSSRTAYIGSDIEQIAGKSVV